MRHTTFRFALDPTPAQEQMFAWHAGASRFAYNECLRFVTDALAAKPNDPSVKVPWSGYDLVNAFNAWKRSEEAGRVFVVGTDGVISKQVTGLAWRQKVSAQVFEEAAVDLGRSLAAYGRAKQDARGGRRFGFPRRKRKGRCRDSFRLRNKRQSGGHLIRVGDGPLRSVTLPTIGRVRVHDDTRRLRQLLRPRAEIDPATGEQRVAPRAKILFATVARRFPLVCQSQRPRTRRSPRARPPAVSRTGERRLCRSRRRPCRVRGCRKIGRNRGRSLAGQPSLVLPASPTAAQFPLLVASATRLPEPRKSRQAAST
jgi:hypothetical protein